MANDNKNNETELRGQGTRISSPTDKQLNENGARKTTTSSAPAKPPQPK